MQRFLNCPKCRYTKSENDSQWYEKLRNVNIKNTRTRTDYFTQKLGEASNDIKQTWKILNSALGKRSKKLEHYRVHVTELSGLSLTLEI